MRPDYGVCRHDNKLTAGERLAGALRRQNGGRINDALNSRRVLVMIIWIWGNLQQLVAYGLGLQLMSTNRYEMLVDWEQYGSALASPFKLINKHAAV